MRPVLKLNAFQTGVHVGFAPYDLVYRWPSHLQTLSRTVAPCSENRKIAVGKRARQQHQSHATLALSAQFCKHIKRLAMALNACAIMGIYKTITKQSPPFVNHLDHHE